MDLEGDEEEEVLEEEEELEEEEQKENKRQKFTAASSRESLRGEGEAEAWCYPVEEEAEGYPGEAVSSRKGSLEEEQTLIPSESSSEPFPIKCECTDSQYNAWLQSYYESIHEEPEIYRDAETQTSLHLFYVRPFLCYCSLVRWKGIDGTVYYGRHEVRRHWALKMNREYLYFPCHYAHVPLPSRYGRYHFQWHVGAAIPESLYKLQLSRSVGKNIRAANRLAPQIRHLIFCDTLANMAWFDSMTRTMMIRTIRNFLRKQIHLQVVCFENMRLTRVEGVVLLCALSENCGDTLLQLHIWKMFGFSHNPLLMDELSIVGTRKYIPKIWTGFHFLEILENFSMLTHLSLNYAYLANRTGDAILSLKCVRYGRLEHLELLCLDEERPLKTNPGYGTAGWTIKDGVWRRVKHLCPNLGVKFIFINLVSYEHVILFMSKSIPMSHVYLSSGIDYHVGMHMGRMTWDIDSTLLELRNWYSDTLEILNLHLWHHRDLLDFVIKAKILTEFPNLKTFEFIGILEDSKTLDIFCKDLATGNFKVVNLLFWVQEVYSKKKRNRRMKEAVDEIKEKYQYRFGTLGIDADIRTYPT